MLIYYVETSSALSEKLLESLFFPVTVSAYYSMIPLVLSTFFHLKLRKVNRKTWLIWEMVIGIMTYFAVGLIQSLFLGVV